MTTLILVVLFLHIIIICLGILAVGYKKAAFITPVNYPDVSVLIAARNEENNIGSCLAALLRQEYPGNFEVWIGNDASEDNTRIVINNFCLQNPGFHWIDITETIGEARGKANVLAQLARKASGKFLFVTDADIIVPVSWLKSMVGYVHGDYSIISGTTIVNGYSFFAKMQEYEWTYLMGFFHMFDVVHPIAAMGNNMAFSRDIYNRVGGYENIPFSVVEDYRLLHEFVRIGQKHYQVLDRNCLAFSSHTTSWKNFLQQRKRWFQGTTFQPFYIIAILAVYAAWFPGLILLCFFDLKFAVLMFVVKLVINGLFFLRITTKLNHRLSLFLLPVFEFYLGITNAIVSFYSIIPGKVKWKGREY